jgi:hypothetical protein
MIKQPRTVKTETFIPTLTIVKYRDRIATALDPVGAPDFPLLDGVTITAAQDGEVAVADFYGGTYAVAEASFAPGHLYAGRGGGLTQDPKLAAATGWIICVGRTVSPTEFIYEPHLPTRSFFTI